MEIPPFCSKRHDKTRRPILSKFLPEREGEFIALSENHCSIDRLRANKRWRGQDMQHTEIRSHSHLTQRHITVNLPSATITTRIIHYRYLTVSYGLRALKKRRFIFCSKGFLNVMIESKSMYIILILILILMYIHTLWIEYFRFIGRRLPSCSELEVVALTVGHDWCLVERCWSRFAR